MWMFIRLFHIVALNDCLILSPSHIVSERSLTAQPSSLKYCIRALQFNHFTQYPHFLSLLDVVLTAPTKTCLHLLALIKRQLGICWPGQQLLSATGSTHSYTHSSKMCVDAWKHKLPWRNCGCFACVCVWTFSLSSLVSCCGIYRCQGSGQRFNYKAWHSECCSPLTGLRLILDLLLTADVPRTVIMNHLKQVRVNKTDLVYERERERENNKQKAEDEIGMLVLPPACRPHSRSAPLPVLKWHGWRGWKNMHT